MAARQETRRAERLVLRHPENGVTVRVESVLRIRSVAVPTRRKASTVMNQPGVLPVFQTKAESKAFYNKISRVYDLLADRSEAPVRRAVLELLAAAKGERILEVGFGTGHCLVALAKLVEPAGKVHGLDLAENMLALARINLKRNRLLDRVE